MDDDKCKLCAYLDRHEKGEDDSIIIYESDFSVAKYQKEPHKFAEVHIMIMTKKHIPSVFDITECDRDIILDIGKAIQVASEEVYKQKGGCKLEMYTGKFPTFTALEHFHCHVIYDSAVD